MHFYCPGSALLLPRMYALNVEARYMRGTIEVNFGCKRSPCASNLGTDFGINQQCAWGRLGLVSFQKGIMRCECHRFCLSEGYLWFVLSFVGAKLAFLDYLVVCLLEIL